MLLTEERQNSMLLTSRLQPINSSLRSTSKKILNALVFLEQVSQAWCKRTQYDDVVGIYEPVSIAKL